MFKKIYFIFFIVIFSSNLAADVPYYVDFKFILNESAAGKKAQEFLKNKLEKGVNGLKTKEKSILEEEKKIIQQKKIIKPEEYREKVNKLRDKVSKLQNERNNLLENIAKQRSKAKNVLLKELNPIIKEYMKQNNIRMVLDKKSLLLADQNLDLTKKIVEILNKKLKSIKLN